MKFATKWLCCKDREAPFTPLPITISPSYCVLFQQINLDILAILFFSVEVSLLSVETSGSLFEGNNEKNNKVQ